MAYSKFFLIIVIALLLRCCSCSMVCHHRLLISQERKVCSQKNPEYLTLDRYVQISCHGSEQSCNATCDGASSENNNTRLRICKEKGKVCIQSLRGPAYVLMVNAKTQDLIFEPGQCGEQSFSTWPFKEIKRTDGNVFKYTYQLRSHGSGMRLECSCRDNRLRLREFDTSTEGNHGLFEHE